MSPQLPLIGTGADHQEVRAKDVWEYTTEWSDAWPVSVFTCCIAPLRGNVDFSVEAGGDPGIDISDLVYLVDYMFTSGPAPECVEEGNMDASDTLEDGEDLDDIDISDLVYLVDYMFTSGPLPLPCPGY